MATRIDTGIHVNAAPADVFALLSDHARLGELGGGRSRLLREGHTDRDGLGAIREIVVNGFRFEEEITAYEPGHSYSYQILSSTLPIDHQGGTVSVTSATGYAAVQWVSSFRLAIPVIGSWLEPLANRQGVTGFQKILRAAKRELEG